MHQAVQPVTDGVFCGTDLLPQLIQGMRGSIRHGVRRQNGVRDLLFQARLGRQRIEQIIGGQRIMVGGAVPGAQVLEIAQRTGHQQQLSHGKDTALDRAGSQRTDPLHAAEPGRAVLDQQGIDGIGLFQHKPDFVGVALRFQLQHFGLWLPGRRTRRRHAR